MNEPLLISSKRGSKRGTVTPKYTSAIFLFFKTLSNKIFDMTKTIIMSDAFVNVNLSEYRLKKSIIKFG